MHKKRFYLNKGVNFLFQTPKDRSFKFGYYNYSPISADGTKMLAHHPRFEGRLPNPEDIIDVGYFDLKSGEWIKLAETNAFNWQQGSMLQWMGPDFNSKCIFNDSDGEKYVARIFDINKNKEKSLSRAIYGLDPNGRFSISMHFERAFYTRAYNYAPIQDETWNKRIPESDGIIKINLETGKYETIIPLKNILKLNQHTNINDHAAHWIEHIMLNPSGNRFAFYHRYGSKNNFATSCFTANIDGSDIWQHPLEENDRVSHLGWRDDNSYVLYTIPQSKLKSAWIEKAKNNKPKFYVRFYRKYLKKFVPGKMVSQIPKAKSFYALTLDQKEVIDKLNPWPGSMDGHPSFTKNGQYMLSDTYADKEGYRNLLIYNLKTQKTYLLGRFYSHFNNCNWRADLHPRFSPDENKVVIDSTHDGYHRMMVLEMDWENIG